MITTFDKTKQWHAIAGVEMPDKPTRPTASAVQLGLSLIAEEFMELLEDGFQLRQSMAVELKASLAAAIADIAKSGKYVEEEAMDALGDMDVVVNRFGGILGFDMNLVSEAVFESNMSKYTTDEVEAYNASARYYAQAGRDTTVTQVLACGQVFYVIKDADTGKILKADSYLPPYFSDVLGGSHGE